MYRCAEEEGVAGRGGSCAALSVPPFCSPLASHVQQHDEAPMCPMCPMNSHPMMPPCPM